MNWELYRSLHNRQLTQAKLAELTGINRSVLARILTNEPGRGKETRVKLFPYLTIQEIGLLDWEAEYAEWAAKNVPRGADFPIEQSSTGNIVPDAQTARTECRALPTP